MVDDGHEVEEKIWKEFTGEVRAEVRAGEEEIIDKMRFKEYVREQRFE